MTSDSTYSVPVLFEDNHLLVVDKPTNMLSQQDNSGDMDLLRILKNDLKKRYNKPGNVYLGLVHRLDRPVGGAMVFAKTSKAASRLSALIRQQQFNKSYVAVVHGELPESRGRLTHYLLKDRSTNTVRVVDRQQAGAKQALLDYSVLHSTKGLNLVRIQLLTGRSHQIRVQFATIGCPLFGDQKYGGSHSIIGQQIALWSTQIQFEHPTTKELMTFHTSPPATHPWHLWPDDVYESHKH